MTLSSVIDTFDLNISLKTFFNRRPICKRLGDIGTSGDESVLATITDGVISIIHRDEAAAIAFTLRVGTTEDFLVIHIRSSTTIPEEFLGA